ncbi:MAG: hypothetical protein RLZZ427_429 [Pseudomonadota bacterium]|jgi:hypothetical protein
MLKIALACAAGGLILAAAPAEARTKQTPQQQLDKLLAGREAGKPVDCISLADTRDMVVIDKTAIVYRGGSVVYVNRPKNPEHLRSDDILVTHPTGSQFCSLDIVETVDRTGHFSTGFISLDSFVPYRRIAKAN